MTDDTTTLILTVLPASRDEATGSREIAATLSTALGTIQKRLNELALEGVIHRRPQDTHTGFKWLYWRHDAGRAATTHAPSTVLGAG